MRVNVDKLVTEGRLQCLIVLLSLLVLVACHEVPLNAQSVPRQQNAAIVAHSTHTAANALAEQYVRQSLAAMGGDQKWQSIGGATASTVRRISHIPDEEADLADDWSAGDLVYTRTTHLDGVPFTRRGTKHQNTQYKVRGQLLTIPRSSDSVILASTYPGVALSLGLHQCAFTVPQTTVDTGASTFTVVQICTTPIGFQESLVWVFSTNSKLPMQVTLPVHDLFRNTVIKQVVTFSSFISVDGLLTPSLVQITTPSGLPDNVSLAHIAFSPTLGADFIAGGTQ